MDLEEMYKNNVPVNARLLLGTMFGNRSPITEKDFSPQELDAMRSASVSAQARQLDQIRNLEFVRNGYERMPPNEAARYTLVPDRGPNGEFGTKKMNVTPASGLVKEYEDRIAKEKRNPGSITYYDYGHGDQGAGESTGKTLDDEGWLRALSRSRNDPSYRMMTALGRARQERDPQNNLVVRDEYSFHGMAPNPMHPTMLLDYLMSKIVPKGQGRDVRINLGPMGNGDYGMY